MTAATEEEIPNAPRPAREPPRLPRAVHIGGPTRICGPASATWSTSLLPMNETVVIDCFPSSVAQYVDNHVIVAIDVIRATTMAVTAVASVRRCVVAADVKDAFAIRDRIGTPCSRVSLEATHQTGST